MNNATIKNKLLAASQNHPAQEIRLTINFRIDPKRTLRMERRAALMAGFNLDTFTGPLSRLFFSSNGQLCFTIRAKERVNVKTGQYCYRTFNVDSGQVRSLEVLR